MDYHDIGFFEIDRVVFANEYLDLSPKELGSNHLSKRWFLVNPSIYTVLWSGSKAVGYCNIMPVRDACFNNLMSGRMSEGEISEEDILRFNPGIACSLYICGIAILPEYRKDARGLISLLAGVRRKFLALQQIRCTVTSVGAVAWSDEGKRIAKLFGLHPVGVACPSGTVYRSPTGVFRNRFLNA